MHRLVPARFTSSSQGLDGRYILRTSHKIDEPGTGLWPWFCGRENEAACNSIASAIFLLGLPVLA